MKNNVRIYAVHPDSTVKRIKVAEQIVHKHLGLVYRGNFPVGSKIVKIRGRDKNECR